jgi:polar amino acid transport system substrate-binding protein
MSFSPLSNQGRCSSTLYLLNCVLLFLLTCGLVACAGQEGGRAQPLGLVIAGTLSVAGDTTNPPQEFIDPHTSQPAGFDVDLITAIARRLGLKVQVLSTKPDLLISDLQYGRYDVAMSAIPITPDRQSRVNFIPYFKAGSSLLVQAGNPARINGLKDLCGLRVAVEVGTPEQLDLQNASRLCQQQGRPSISLRVRGNQSAVVQALKGAQVVATYQDSASSDYVMKLNPGRFGIGGGVVNASLEGIAVNKDNRALYQALSTTLNSLKRDMTYHRLILKWGLVSGEAGA